MTQPCLDLVRFADGELEPERAESFRAHLRTCAACQAGLVEAMQLSARLSALPPPHEHVKLAPEPAGEEPAVPGVPFHRPGRKPGTPSKRRLALFLGGAALPAAAIVAIVVFRSPHGHERDPGPGKINLIAGLT